jgi:hypothetical protein
MNGWLIRETLRRYGMDYSWEKIKITGVKKQIRTRPPESRNVCSSSFGNWHGFGVGSGRRQLEAGKLHDWIWMLFSITHCSNNCSP